MRKVHVAKFGMVAMSDCNPILPPHHCLLPGRHVNGRCRHLVLETRARVVVLLLFGTQLQRPVRIVVLLFHA